MKIKKTKVTLRGPEKIEYKDLGLSAQRYIDPDMDMISLPCHTINTNQLLVYQAFIDRLVNEIYKP